AAVADAERSGIARVVVAGDLGRLQRAAAILGEDMEIVSVDAPAAHRPGALNVSQVGQLPSDLPWGTLSAVAGDAAYHYVRVASELAMEGSVQAICTAPLNKEALHAAGHTYPGHTELLASLTGTQEVSMLLSTPKL